MLHRKSDRNCVPLVKHSIMEMVCRCVVIRSLVPHGNTFLVTGSGWKSEDQFGSDFDEQDSISRSFFNLDLLIVGDGFTLYATKYLLNRLDSHQTVFHDRPLTICFHPIIPTEPLQWAATGSLDLVTLELICADVATLFWARFAALIGRKQMTLVVCAAVRVARSNRGAAEKQGHCLRRSAVVLQSAEQGVGVVHVAWAVEVASPVVTQVVTV